MKKFTLTALPLLFLFIGAGCQSGETTLDFYVRGVSNPVIELDGTWKINTKPVGEFWQSHQQGDDWKEIQVPGEAMMQGVYIKHDEPFAYQKQIDIPADYDEKKIYLQFDGVYSYARVWINGKFIREHNGGFTRWLCDITSQVEAGKKALITVEVTDRTDDISYASGYAKHPIGGILRDVNLLALPINHPIELKIETDLDEQYQNAELTVIAQLTEKDTDTKIELELMDSEGRHIELENNVAVPDNQSFSIKNSIDNPKKWDAEHPNLYSIRISLYKNGSLTWSKKQKIGFREVKVEGNEFFVNGKPVKLRGACRHDVHPTLGRVSTPEYELKDVLLAKEANMNYIRTSHYPPSENFLKLCDEYGLYVEDETAVCFVIDYRIKGYEVASSSQSDPAYTDRYLSQLKEMVNTHRNHPSVVIWSIGNESIYGSNFQKSYDWIRKNDPTRPVMFSYPGSAPDSLPQPYDILSMHYPPITGDLNQHGLETKAFGYDKMPVIYDEWAHVACYNNATIKEDPNIRDFWGRSLDSMWIKTFDSDGGLGGAIWGMIDETFMLPENLEGFGKTWGRTGENDATILGYEGPTVGYGEWGIVDSWRRKKPEFWSTKKAYSPIRLMTTQIENYKSGKSLKIPIYNRFDHTNLNEIKITYSYKDRIETVSTINLEPHEKGNLVLPIKNWDALEPIKVSFYNSKNALIDDYTIKQKVTLESNPISQNGNIKVLNKGNILTVYTQEGNFMVNKKTGLLSSIEQNGNSLGFSGPHILYRTKGKKLTYSSNAINTYGGKWKLYKFKYEIMGNKVVLKIHGVDDKINIEYEIVIYANGTITTDYTYKGLPKENVRELGIKYTTDNTFDALSWKRNPYWSTYPEGHLSAATGIVALYTDTLNIYREKPLKAWTMDTKSFYYSGTAKERKDDLVNIAKATKENILEYSLLKNGANQIVVAGQGDVSCRLAKKGEILELHLINKLDYINLGWGNYQRNIILDGTYSGEIEMKFKSSPNKK